MPECTRVEFDGQVITVLRNSYETNVISKHVFFIDLAPTPTTRANTTTARWPLTPRPVGRRAGGRAGALVDRADDERRPVRFRKLSGYLGGKTTYHGRSKLIVKSRIGRGTRAFRNKNHSLTMNRLWRFWSNFNDVVVEGWFQMSTTSLKCITNLSTLVTHQLRLNREHRIVFVFNFLNNQ